MKLEANIKWTANGLGKLKAHDVQLEDLDVVLVDADYVSPDESSICEWVENELAQTTDLPTLTQGRDHVICGEDFEITNLADIIDDLGVLADDEALTEHEEDELWLF